jgi:hypothetical protein
MSKATTRKTRIAAVSAAAAVVVPSVFGIATSASAAVSTLPTITKLSVVSGSTGGATNVLITGKNFSTVATGTPANVAFGAVAASSFLILSDTQIAAVAATGHTGGVFQVKVTNTTGASADTAADDFTFVAPFTTSTDTAQKLNPFGGTAVVATSSVGWTDLPGFKAAKITATVNGVKAAVAYKTATTATVTVPAGTPSSTAAAVLLYKNGFASTAGGTPAAKYATVITKLSVNSGPVAGGTSVSITGKGLLAAGSINFGYDASGAATTASVLNAATCTIVSDTSATCVSPIGPNDGSVAAASGSAATAIRGAVSVTVVPAAGIGTANYMALPAAAFTYTD